MGMLKYISRSKYLFKIPMYFGTINLLIMAFWNEHWADKIFNDLLEIS